MTNKIINHFSLKYDNNILGDLSFYSETNNCFVVFSPKNKDFFNSSKLIVYEIKNQNDLDKNKEVFLEQFHIDSKRFESDKLEIEKPEIADFSVFYKKFIKAMKEAGI